jgi:hypothetical protein
MENLFVLNVALILFSPFILARHSYKRDADFRAFGKKGEKGQ